MHALTLLVLMLSFDSASRPRHRRTRDTRTAESFRVAAARGPTPRAGNVGVTSLSTKHLRRTGPAFERPRLSRRDPLRESANTLASSAARAGAAEPPNRMKEL